ncbi:MAG: hypothetical protein ABIE68_00435 [bacterium]
MIIRTFKVVLIVTLLAFTLSAFGCKDEPTTDTTITTETKETTSEKNSLAAIAENFTTIYGTFSTNDEKPFSNLLDLKNYASKSLGETFQSKADGAKKQNNGTYYSISTTALNSTIINTNTAKTEVLVTVKQEERKENAAQTKSFYKTIIIKFIKEQGQWKVDQATWQ